jgi:hypothetical protein
MARTVRRRPDPTGGLLRTLERSGLRKGLGGSKTWFYVGTGLWTLRTVRRMAERREEVLISERLAPGQRIVIANGRATIDQAPTASSGRRARRGRRSRQGDVVDG